jgi:hypothetical protein
VSIALAASATARTVTNFSHNNLEFTVDDNRENSQSPTRQKAGLSNVPNPGGLRQGIVKKELMASGGNVRHYVYPASRRWQSVSINRQFSSFSGMF